MWAMGIPFICLLIFTAIWGYQYNRHSTPEKAQKTYDREVGSFETIPFAKGVVLLTPGDSPNSLTAWYMEKGFWGWHSVLTSSAEFGLDPHNYNVDFESFAMDGKTFVWGTCMTPIKEIIYHHKGKTYICSADKSLAWHMILPFSPSVFYHSELTMVRPNGKIAPLFK
jgi:hypothetical protein